MTLNTLNLQGYDFNQPQCLPSTDGVNSLLQATAADFVPKPAAAKDVHILADQTPFVSTTSSAALASRAYTDLHRRER